MYVTCTILYHQTESKFHSVQWGCGESLNVCIDYTTVCLSNIYPVILTCMYILVHDLQK